MNATPCWCQHSTPGLRAAELNANIPAGEALSAGCCSPANLRIQAGSHVHRSSRVSSRETHKYLGVHLSNKLDWSHNTDVLHKKSQSPLHLLRRLRSFEVCRTLLQKFHDTVVASAVFLVCWGGGSTERDRKRPNKLFRFRFCRGLSSGLHRGAVEVTQPYKVVSTNGTAQVQCFVQSPSSFYTNQLFKDGSSPFLHSDPEELRVTLLKGLHSSQVLCSSMLRIDVQSLTGVEKEGQVQCSAQMREGAVEVTVSGLKAVDTDIYRCEIEVFFPPPYLKLTGNGTLIHVLDSSGCPVPAAQRQTAHRADEDMDDEDDERTSPVSVPVLVLVILVTIALLFIMYLQALQCAQGRREMVRPVPAVLYKEDAAYSC
uniref:uncharacterized protein cd28 n=1 Tax=Semicossyphus pulcher TaxID=241346 RepID=UPI0037E769BC